MPKKYRPEQSEWHYPVRADEIETTPKTVTFTASEQERADLARRYGIVSIDNVKASVTLQRAPGGVIHAMGFVHAEITQSCVVTLVPLHSRIEEEFEGWYADRDKAVSFAKAKNEREAQKNHTEAEILEESEDPEPIIDGMIDVGELAAQYLSLAIDPYPHAEGATREYMAEPKEEETVRKNPFEALKDWKEKR